MFDFADKLIGYIEAAWNYYLNILESFSLAVQYIAHSTSFAIRLIAFVPPIIGSAIVVFYAIYLVKFLIGR